ncbi:hypothetical protein JRO89_XS07G0159700 [Xanthoceras sorbifolium]|uniref:DNA-directed RNA polymerase n=1 Tax=Xanthoceras sorbifolium TaxID=99658 RepID=A0ABQ8HU35_9ROSI|nr:hypothetical protein JRO89_XS07G0159700 [Xanthoceras sorbifolium]
MLAEGLLRALVEKGQVENGKLYLAQVFSRRCRKEGFSLKMSGKSKVAVMRYAEISWLNFFERLLRKESRRYLEKDKKLMKQQLSLEITDEIVPAAIDMQVNIFYGSTASGIKCLDPLFNLLNPSPLYCVKILEQIPSSQTCKAGGKPRTDVANHVQ